MSAAKERMIRYLHEHFIPFTECCGGGVPHIHLLYQHYDYCPDRALESSMYFHENTIESSVYYTRSGRNFCQNSEHRDGLLQVLNYLNASVWPAVSGGVLYQTSQLYTSRFYMTEEFDICCKTLVPYDFFDLAPIETADYLTAACPDLLNELSFYLFCVLLGQSDAETVIRVLKNSDL